MNSVDKDIEQFEKNLVEINIIKEQIANLSTTLKKIVSETGDINEIKSNINKEITTLNIAADNTEKKINNEVQSLKNIANEVKNSIGKDAETIVKPINETMSKLYEQANVNTKILADELEKIKMQMGKFQEDTKKHMIIIKIMITISILISSIILITR